MSVQKPGEKPNKPGPRIEVDRKNQPVFPPHREVSKPGVKHLPPTQAPGQKWKTVTRQG